MTAETMRKELMRERRLRKEAEEMTRVYEGMVDAASVVMILMAAVLIWLV